MANQKSVFACIRDGFSYIDENSRSEDNSFRRDILNEIESFVYNGEYTNYRNKEKFLALEREKYSSEEMAKKLKVSVGGIRQARKRISQDAFSVLGADVFEKVLYGDAHDCSVVHDNLKVLNDIYSSSEFILDEIVEKLKDTYFGDGTETFDLLDCQNEMLFLSLFTTSRVSHLIENLDSDKLNYLLRLIYGKKDTITEKMLVLKYIAGNSDKKRSAMLDFLRSSL